MRKALIVGIDYYENIGSLNGAVNDALSRLTNLALCDVEVVHGTCFLRNTAS